MKFHIKDAIKNAKEEEQSKKNTGPTLEPDKNELEFNREHRENYEQLMRDSSTNLDDYYDKDNPLVRLILLGLGSIIVVGVLYYVLKYLGKW